MVLVRIVVFCSPLLLTACISTQAAQPPIPAITCKQGQDCDAKWSRAVAWVSQNSAYRMQVQSDVLIQTYNSTNTDIAVVVNKVATKQPGDYEIDVSISCGNPIGCVPDARDQLIKFNTFVNG